MSPESPVYCETMRCRMTFATCLARRRMAEIKTDWDAPGYRACLSCPVGADTKHGRATKTTMRRQYGFGAQELIELPEGKIGKICSLCGKLKGLHRFRKSPSLSSGYRSECMACQAIKDKIRKGAMRHESLQNQIMR